MGPAPAPAGGSWVATGSSGLLGFSGNGRRPAPGLQPVPATDRHLAGIGIHVAGLGAKLSALTLAATLAAHAATPAIGGMLHLSLTLATAMAIAHATAISRSPCLGSASGDQAGRSQGQGEEIECFHAVVPVCQIMGWIHRTATM